MRRPIGGVRGIGGSNTAPPTVGSLLGESGIRHDHRWGKRVSQIGLGIIFFLSFFLSFFSSPLLSSPLFQPVSDVRAAKRGELIRVNTVKWVDERATTRWLLGG